MLALELPDFLTFEPNKAYLSELLNPQIDLTMLGARYMRDARERFEQVQEQIHGGEESPSKRGMTEHDAVVGRGFRQETEARRRRGARRPRAARPLNDGESDEPAAHPTPETTPLRTPTSCPF